MSSPESGPNLRVLSIDDGGARGLSVLLILKEIMFRVQSHENLATLPAPCERFDLIGGSGTGGLIALMLGRLGMSVDECIKAFERLANEVFRDISSLSRVSFKAENLEKVMKAIIMEKTGDRDARMMVGDGEVGKHCKTFVCAMSKYNLNASIPRLLRTYRTPSNPSVDCMIWEAARATTADPTFFKSIKIGSAGSSEEYIGASLSRSNPIHQVLEECALVDQEGTVECIISICAGKATTIQLPRRMFPNPFLPDRLVKAMRLIALDCDRSSEEIARRFGRTSDIYFRFDVEQGMQNMKRQEWERVVEVTAHTTQYLLSAGTGARLDSAMRKLSGPQSGLSALISSGVIQLNSEVVGFNLKLCPQPTPIFTGRDDIVQKMDSFFSSVQKRKCFVLYGVGGGGKSQVVYKFVLQWWDDGFGKLVDRSEWVLVRTI